MNSKARIYTVHERIWHAVQGLCLLVLLATGFHIHSPWRLPLPDFETAVRIHNAAGFLLAANAFLGLFYYATSGSLRQYVPQRRGWLEAVVAQVKYYTGGIFRGEPHPARRTVQCRLNPLQQLTYLAILNVLLPLQIVSGLAIWGASRWPQAAAAVGGLPVLGAVHTLGAWLFLSFLIGHLYLITTGHTPLSNLQAMATGYEELEGETSPVEEVCQT